MTEEKSEYERIEEFLNAEYRHPSMLMNGSFDQSSTVGEGDGTVVITADASQEPEVFHSRPCHRAPDDTIELDRSEALDSGLRECKLCNGEVSGR